MSDPAKITLKSPDYICLLNPDRLEERQARALLADNATRLLAHSERIFASSNGISYRIDVGGQILFAKEITHRASYKHWLDRLVKPTSFVNFANAGRLLRAGLPTPMPVLAAYIYASRRPRQFIVTDFCEDAVGLGDYARQTADAERRDYLVNVANLLTTFHCKGFYSRHLRAANIIVQAPLQRGGGHRFWLIDLDRLGSTRFMPTSVFTSTVTRACAEFYDDLTPDERTFLLRTCFDAALKANIFSRPSQQEGFFKTALRMIRLRR